MVSIRMPIHRWPVKSENVVLVLILFPMKWTALLAFNLPANLDSNLVTQSICRSSLDHLRWLRLICDP